MFAPTVLDMYTLAVIVFRNQRPFPLDYFQSIFLLFYTVFPLFCLQNLAILKVHHKATSPTQRHP